ncbi:hypothetical protein ACGFK1_32510 [Mycobacterium sp. NPDC048908]|uniref:hypothetical protein n=1 Tax=Mycobacterium sp. NPDC048908 TaxID=3364292 RepID=UPI00371CF744
MVVSGVVCMGLLAVAPLQQASAAPVTECDGVACEVADNVGTAVHVVIHKFFQEVADPDQCTGALTLATVRRGSSVLLSQGSLSDDTPKVAIGQFYRSRMKDGTCEALYITSAPVLPTFNAQFVGPDGQLSSTFGPVTSESVTDQPGIQQAVRIDMEFPPES